MILEIKAFNIVTPKLKTISFSLTNLNDINKLLITASNLEDARIVALAAFKFDQNLIKLSGYNVVYSLTDHLSSNSSQYTYTSPNPRAEISRFSSSVKEEIMLGLNTKLSEDDSNKIFNLVLREMGISHLIDRNPLHLSGGEIAKVILATHLIHKPKVWIIDRTLNELDNNSRANFFNILKKELFDDTLIVIVDYPDLLSSMRFDKTWKVTGSKVDQNYKIKTEINNQKDVFSDHLSIITKKIINKNTKLLQIKNFTVRRGNKLIIEDFCYDFHSNQIFWITGKNGSGKTTLFEAMTNIITSWSGKISYDHIYNKQSLSEIISYSPQDADIDITEDNLTNEIAFAMFKINYNKQSKLIAREWLLNLGLSENEINNNTLNNSGERKLASVLSAFARKKPIIILDEPSLFLSRSEIHYINNAAKDHFRNNGILIIATHDPRLFSTLDNKNPEYEKYIHKPSNAHNTALNKDAHAGR